MEHIELSYLPKQSPVSYLEAHRCKDYNSLKVHMHGHEELLFITSHSLCEVSNNGNRFQVRAPALLLNHSGTYHEVISVSNQGDMYDSRILFFEYSALREIISAFSPAKRLFEGDCCVVTLTDEAAADVHKFYDIIKDEIPLYDSAVCILAALLNKMAYLSKKLPYQSFTSYKNYVFDIIRSISDNPQKSLSLEQWASKYNVSQSKLKCDFYNVTGTTVKAFSLNMRLHKSAALLDDSNVTVAGVAYECGFSSESHFISHFKKIFGVTPGEYRSKRSIG